MKGVNWGKKTVPPTSASRHSTLGQKRHLNRSVKISSEIYSRLLELQGFLQLRERHKRSIDELLEFVLAEIPDLELDADQHHLVLQHPRIRSK